MNVVEYSLMRDYYMYEVVTFISALCERVNYSYCSTGAGTCTLRGGTGVLLAFMRW